MYTDQDDAIWRDSAAILNAEFIPAQAWHSPKAIKLYKGIKIVFDSYFHTAISGIHSYESFCVRVCVIYKSRSDFYFKIVKPHFKNFLRQLINSRTFKTGDREFDKKFAAKTNDDYILAKILESERTRDLIKSLDKVNLQIGDMQGIWGDKLPDGTRELSYYCDGRTIADEELLILNELFEKLIDNMFKLGIADASVN